MSQRDPFEEHTPVSDPQELLENERAAASGLDDRIARIAGRLVKKLDARLEAGEDELTRALLEPEQ